jgi:hypothetical protein
MHIHKMFRCSVTNRLGRRLDIHRGSFNLWARKELAVSGVGGHGRLAGQRPGCAKAALVGQSLRSCSKHSFLHVNIRVRSQLFTRAALSSNRKSNGHDTLLLPIPPRRISHHGELFDASDNTEEYSRRSVSLCEPKPSSDPHHHLNFFSLMA